MANRSERKTTPKKNSGIISDYKKTQQITGLIAAGGIVFTALDIFVFPMKNANLGIVWLFLGILAVFTALFFLTPAIYMKKWLAFLPDIVYSSGILIMMINLGDRGYLLTTLLILLVAISAFTKSSWMFGMLFFETLMVITLFYLITFKVDGTVSFSSIIFQILGIAAIMIILRTFASEAIYLRNSQRVMTESMRQIGSQRDEILALINNLSEGLISVDKNQKITIANTSAVSMLADTADSKGVVGKVLNDVMPVSSNEASLSLVDQALKEGKQVSRDDLKLVTPTGMYRISASTTPIVDRLKRQMGAIIMFRDVTAEKSLDEQRAEFNAIASHELRTPLMVIEGFTYSILASKKLRYDDKTRGYITQIDTAVKNLIGLTNDILTVTKSDNNQIKVVFEKVDVKKIIKESVEELRPKAKLKNLKLNLKVASNLPMVLTDAGKFKEITLNLVENAIKFTEKGSVTVTANENEKGIVLVRITDTGEGINPYDQKRVFNRFFRVNDFRTQKTGGTGLGLYISRTFVTALGGEIGVESKKGQGSTFWFSIPVTVKKKIKRKKSEKQLDDFIQSI